jgi:hypothetical protein
VKKLALPHRWHVRALIRVACYLGIAALVLMALSALVPAALPVVIGMSLGQGLGVLAFLCYLLAVLTDMSRAPPPSIAPSSKGSEHDHDSDSPVEPAPPTGN